MLIVVFSCATSKKSVSTPAGVLNLQGHRGARGLMPENTVHSMKKAIDLGVSTLEMDVVISKDNKVVVSHDTYFSEQITTTPEGKYLTKKEAVQHLLYQMPYDSIKKYDVGLKPHPGFPKQQKIQAHKPLLCELIDSSEAYARSKGKRMLYNIEIKSKIGFDGVNHPDPTQFADLVMQVIREKKILNRTTIQSFDIRPLQYVHQNYPGVVLSYLVDKTSTSLQDQIKALGFEPDVYSPHFTAITTDMIKQCHHKNIKVIPWTVNTVEEMNAMISMGVDGIISDYPDLFDQIRQQAN
jgi:glycerophosphoryl diester phosphodiesterase